MFVATETLWLAATNTYVAAPDTGQACIIVDAPPDPDPVLDIVRQRDLTPVALLLTHGHVDHTGGAATIEQSAATVTYVHPDDDFLTLHPEEQLRVLFGRNVQGRLAVPRNRLPLRDGMRLRLAGMEIDVLHTPGHTPGHCCFLIGGALFSGDHLFAGSIGRTDLPGGDFDQLMESMERKIMPLPDETVVYPGHGPATTLGAERRTNPFLQ